MSVEQLLVGSDPEIFVQDRRTKEFRSAHAWMPGTKKVPHPTTFGAIQLDGVAAEFNIIPTDNVTDFIRRMYQGMGCIQSFAKKHDENLIITATPVATFKPNYWATLPESVLELGCDPDFNAWKGGQNERPYTDQPFRTGSGHIHLGWYPKEFYQDDPNNQQHFFDCIHVTKNMDFVLFLMSKAWDNDTKRRTLYGSRGTFRPKPYGVEYRVLSNAWLNHSLLMGWIFNVSMRILHMIDEDVKLYDDKQLQKYMDLADENKLTWPQLAVIHAILVDQYKMPPLPKFVFNPTLRKADGTPQA